MFEVNRNGRIRQFCLECSAFYTRERNKEATRRWYRRNAAREAAKARAYRRSSAYRSVRNLNALDARHINERVDMSRKPKPKSSLQLKDLPKTEWWTSICNEYPTVDCAAELLKAMDWYGADQVKSPKLYFRNWVAKAASWQPPAELTPDELRARLRVVA
jgi:hypothetical protein